MNGKTNTAACSVFSTDQTALEKCIQTKAVANNKISHLHPEDSVSSILISYQNQTWEDVPSRCCENRKIHEKHIRF